MSKTLKWFLILLVPGIFVLSSLPDSNDSAKTVPTSAQVQNIAPQVQSAEGKTNAQVEQKTETVQVAKPVVVETAKPALKPVTSTATCGSDYYRNVDGNCVHRPSANPSGASAKCRDGSYSYSQNRRGTCSGHGGVATWY